MHKKEKDRLKALNRFLNLELSKKNELQDIVNLAAKICNTPIALITLIGDSKQHIKFKYGINLNDVPKEESFCVYTIANNGIMIVPDALKDSRFIKNRYVLGDPNVRFYAGSPLITQDGEKLGSLCVLDRNPGGLNELQQDMLLILSRQVINILEFESSVKILKDQFMELKISENKLRSFFESSSSCHMLIGRKMEIIAYNKSLEDFIYRIYNIKVVLGTRVPEYLHKDYVKDFLHNYNAALNGISTQSQLDLTYGNETIFWDVSYEPAYDPNGDIIGVSYNASDITEKVVSSRKLEQQRESLKTIAFIQSHELRKPVASILGLIGIFKEQGYNADQESLKMMEAAVNELDEKIHLIVGHTD